jgi:hypothetical protein
MPRESEFIESRKKLFKLAQEATKKQRDREREDLAFYGGQQWSPDALKARAAQTAGADIPFPAPARPSLVINLVRESVRQVLNIEQNADYAIELVPADDFAGLEEQGNDSEIELREGLTRRIQRASEAEDARTWAGARAAIAGVGHYGVMTRYLPGKTFDQEVYIRRFYDQSCVMLDPAHTEPDGSDAEWEFETNDYMSWDEYQRTWDKNADGHRNDACNNDVFQSLVTGDPEWFRQDGDHRYVRITDHWYVEFKARTLLLLADGSMVWDDELNEDRPIQEKRRVVERQVHWCKMDGIQRLEQTDWPCPFLPIIKVLGEELQPFDQERRAEGMVRPSRDSQMGFNAMTSKWVETIGLSPIPPFQATPDQIQGFEKWYQYANIYAAPYLPYNAVSDGGKPLGPPTRTPVDTPIAALAASVQMFRDAVQSTTGIHDPQLGKVDPSLKSGRAIQALQQQSAHGTSNFLDNLKRSIRYEGQIINGLLEPIYGKPGRIARLLTKEGEPQTVRIGPPSEGSGAQVPGAVMGQSAPKTYTLTKDANFNVVVRVSQGFDTRRAEEAAVLGDLIGKNPVLMTWFGDLFLKSLDSPQHQEMADRAKLMLDPHIQAGIQAKAQGNGDISPAAQAQIMQLTQRVQQAEQIMQQMQGELQGKQAENQTKLQIAQLQMNQALELRKMQDATAISVAKINALTKGVISDNEAEVERIALAEEAARTQAQMQHDERMAGREHAHQHIQAQVDRAHEVATMGMEHATASEEAEASREHEMALAAAEPTEETDSEV